MKKVIFGFLLLNACSPKMVEPSLYQTDVVSVHSNLSYEEVWSKMIDILSTMGTSIKVLDKSSGLMTTDQYSLINSYTFQNKKGDYINPDAYVVLGKVKRPGGIAVLKPSNIVGSWNIRIKPEGDHITVNVNLVNLKAYLITSSQYGTSTYNFPVKSTGNFEKFIADKLK